MKRSGAEKCFYRFVEEEIDLNTFLRLKESDLERLHIRQMGPRKKVLEEIDRLQTGRPRSNVYLGLPKHKLFEMPPSNWVAL